mmetsp:Transcript_56005/g.133439  ORF Transcript_56005/g.133439 Transcript_56005/m.133439 type:complete len:496 (-) Transcript_56005:39-1526(-)
MFQPAGVRTLLDLRTADPTRPATARVRGQIFRDGQSCVESKPFTEQVEGDARPSSAPAAVELLLSAPSTACPSTASSSASGRGSSLLVSDDPFSNALSLHRRHLQEEATQDVHCEELPVLDEGIELEDEEDVPAMLERASTVLHQLKHAWREEREADLDQYWRGMEEFFGQRLDRSPASRLIGEAAVAADDSIEDCDSQDEAEVIRKELQEAEEFADAAEKLVLEQVEATRALREELERKLQHAVTLESATALGTSTASAAIEEDLRLQSLRQEVQDLHVRFERGPFAEELSDDDAPLASAVAIDIEGPAPPELSALHRWMEEMQSFSMSIAGTTSPARSPAAAGPKHASARTAEGCGSSSSTPTKAKSPSKEMMVRMAEARALEWAASRTRASPKGSHMEGRYGAPCSSPAGSSTGLTAGRQLQSPSAAKPPQKSSLLLNDEAAGSGARSAQQSPLGSPQKSQSHAIEEQLDDILRELDEIDRIHDDLHQLTRP